MNGPELWLIGGPNGAGKTTLCSAEEFQSQLEGVQLLNPDQVTLRLLRQRGFTSFAEAPPAVLRQANMEAADEVFRELVDGVANRRLVGVETVLSTDKYKSPVTAARALNGRFYLIYVSLASPALSLARVQQRVRQGGHDVPSDRLADRWRRSLELLPWFAAHADDFWVFDNSSSERCAPILLARGWRLESGETQMELPHPTFDSPIMEVLRRCPFTFLPTGDTEAPL